MNLKWSFGTSSLHNHFMRFETPLLKAKMIKRYKRFFADVELQGTTVTVHCPNTGSLKSCWEVGRAAYISPASNPDRKLKYTLELTESPHGTLVGVNTSWPNKLVKEAFDNKVISDWKDFNSIQMEVKISKETRLDGVMKKTNGVLRYFEVKNVTLEEKGIALFPDAETTRGQKHLEELMELKRLGHEAEIIFTIQREDCKAFSPAIDYDPVYASLLKEAYDLGVVVRPLVVSLSEQELLITEEALPIRW